MTSIYVKRTAQVAALAAAFTMSGSAFALASTNVTSGDNSILGGNQINAPVSLPIDLCGISGAIIGTALSGCQGGASVSTGGSGGYGHGGSTHVTSGDNSILGGNQINVPISAPVSACGTSVSAVGTSASGCRGGASVSGDDTGSGGGGTWVTSGNNSILGGNQINAPISIPVSVCGISAAIVGTALSGCEGGASVASGGGGDTWITSGDNSIGGGNQINAPVSAPISVCGISAAVVGTAVSGCGGGAHVGPPPPPPGHCRHHHHPTPPPGHHRHHHPTPPRHHGGGGAAAGSSPIPPTQVTGASLPTTGANFLGLLALAGGALVAGAGSMVFAAKRGALRGLLAFTRRTSAVSAR